MQLRVGRVKRTWKRLDVGVTRFGESPVPSPYETEPTCAHFEQCSGCHFGHLQYGRQLIEKKRLMDELWKDKQSALRTG